MQVHAGICARAQAQCRSTHLAADGSRGLLTAALPGAKGAVHVVEAGNAAVDAKVVVVVLVQLLGAQLL